MLDSKDVLKIFTEHLALRDPITIDIDNIKTEFDAEKELAAFNVLHSITEEIPGGYINNFINIFNEYGYGVTIVRQYDSPDSEIVKLNFAFNKRINPIMSIDYAIRLMLRSFYNFISVPCLVDLNNQLLNDRSKILWESFDGIAEYEYGDTLLKFQYLLDGLIFPRYEEYFYDNRINDGRILEIFDELAKFLSDIFDTVVEYDNNITLTENFIKLRSTAIHSVNNWIESCFDVSK
nr:MAG TPA: hypothetical protein [Caudoviricetes sp.]